MQEFIIQAHPSYAEWYKEQHKRRRKTAAIVAATTGTNSTHKDAQSTNKQKEPLHHHHKNDARGSNKQILPMSINKPQCPLNLVDNM